MRPRKVASSKPRRTSSPSRRPRKPASEPARPVKDERARRRIIRAAAEAYREHGYEGTNMIDIGKRLGVTAPALYWYFRSKEEILFAFLEHTILDLKQFVQALMKSSDPVERLREFVYAYVLWQLQQKELSAAYERIFALGHLRNSLPEVERNRIKALEREFFVIGRDAVTGAAPRMPESQATAIVFALIGMVEHLITWFDARRQLAVAQVADLYADLAVKMVMTEAPPARRPR